MTTGTWLTAVRDAILIATMRHPHHALTNDLTIRDDLKRFRSVREQSHEFTGFSEGNVFIHLLHLPSSSTSSVYYAGRLLAI